MSMIRPLPVLVAQLKAFGYGLLCFACRTVTYSDETQFSFLSWFPLTVDYFKISVLINGEEKVLYTKPGAEAKIATFDELFGRVYRGYPIKTKRPS